LRTLQKIILLSCITLFFTTSIFGNGVVEKNISDKSDSLKIYLQKEFSLFYEYYKNKDYTSADDYLWEVLRIDPETYLRYHPFKKMETILWWEYDSLKTLSDEERAQVADTTLYLYKQAIKYVPKKKAYFLAKTAYIMHLWKKMPADTVISVYEQAIAADPNLQSGYKDRLGLLYAKNATEENGYKLKALELYSALSDAEPDNALWNSRMENLAEDISELVDITGKAWDLNRESAEKAWKYASMAIKAEDYEKAIVPLAFLCEKSPDVVNYHKQIAKCYEKLMNTESALAEYKSLIKLEPNNRDNYFNIALIYNKMGQFSVARSYLHKALKVSPDWDFPVYLEAQIYEQAARDCGFEFMDRVVYQLAVDTYRKAARMHGQHASAAKDRVNALKNSVPQREDYFFRKLNTGDKVKIEGKCYGWIGKSIIVP